MIITTLTSKQGNSRFIWPPRFFDDSFLLCFQIEENDRRSVFVERLVTDYNGLCRINQFPDWGDDCIHPSWIDKI